MKNQFADAAWLLMLATAIACMSSFTPTRAFAQRVRSAPERQAPPRMMTLPPNHVRVNIGNRPYYYHQGRFYRGWRGHYYMYRPPFGARLPFLPYGFWSFRIGPALYFYGGGVYYQYVPSERMYVVVPRPNQAPAAPSGDDDILYLTNGQTLSGVFVGANADSIHFQVKDSVQTVPITEVKSINFAPSSFKEKK